MNILTFTTRGCIKRFENVHIVYNKKNENSEINKQHTF